MHEGFEHFGIPALGELGIGHRLQPVTAEDIDAEPGLEEVIAEEFRTVDATMSVVEVGFVEGILGGEQAEDDTGLPVEGS